MSGDKKFYINHPGILGMKRDHKEGIQRSDLFVCRTSDVQDNDYKAVKFGVEKIIAEVRKSLRIVDHANFNYGDNDYGSADWYQTKALTLDDTGLGKQVGGIELDLLLHDEPYQQEHPHFDVMVVGNDLTLHQDCGHNFIFGFGPYPHNIISTRRFRHFFKNRKTREQSIAVLTAHEVGHNFGLLSRNFNMGTQGLRACHCDGEQGPCVMEQINVPGCRAIDEQASLICNRENWLCIDCTDHIQFIRQHLEGVGIEW